MRKWIQMLLSEIHCRRPLFWFLHPHHDTSHTLSILHWCYHRHESYSLNLNELMASATKNSLAWLEKVLTAVLHMVWVPVFKRKMRKLILKLNGLGQKVKVVFSFVAIIRLSVHDKKKLRLKCIICLVHWAAMVVFDLLTRLRFKAYRVASLAAVAQISVQHNWCKPTLSSCRGFLHLVIKTQKRNKWWFM